MIFRILFFILTVTEIHSQKLPSSILFKFPKDNTPNWKVRIIGGNEVTPANLYPFQVALYIRYSSTLSLCGGSLISEEWVLTAAHCVDNNPLYVDVILGAHNLSNNIEPSQQIIRSQQYYVHEKWNANLYQNDIALIKLPQLARLDDNIGLIKIATGSDTYDGQNGIILGWGLTNTGQTSDVLLQVIVEILSNLACKSIHPSYNQIIQNTHLCTSGVGIRGSCNGDSGGPLIFNNTLVGLVSFGHDECNLGFPSVFTRITSFTNWINYTMENGAGTKINFNYFILCFLIMSIYVY